MGLFDGGAKRESAENSILQAFSEQPILEDLIMTVLQNENEWITKCQGYYDDRKRKITIGADMFMIQWLTTNNVNGQNTDNIAGEVAYAYTKSGYTPLHHHVNAKGKEDVSVGRVIYLWASIVRERMQAKMPDCVFDSIIEYDDHATFTYSVPALEWKRWF